MTLDHDPGVAVVVDAITAALREAMTPVLARVRPLEIATASLRARVAALEARPADRVGQALAAVDEILTGSLTRFAEAMQADGRDPAGIEDTINWARDHYAAEHDARRAAVRAMFDASPG